MVKFLHTADWHLGIGFRGLGPRAEKAREIRIETAKRLMISAKENDVDFVVVSGDLFDSNDVDRRLISAAGEAIGEARPLPVYVLPGNHDPLTRDSLYHDPVWDSLVNAVLLTSDEPLDNPELGLTLYPCPACQKQTREDPTEHIDVIGDNISIGIAHGNLRIEGLIDEPSFPIDPQRADKSGLDYLALGEWHSMYLHEGKDKVIRTVYPGTPETTKFGEPNSGKAAIVEIEDHGSKPLIDEIDVGTLKWEEWTKEVSDVNDIKHVKRELEKIGNPQERLVRLSLSGVVDQEVVDRLASFQEEKQGHFFHFEMERQNLHLKPNLAKLKAMIPEGAVFNKTVSAIQALMRCQPKLQDYSQIPPERADDILRDIRDVESALDASPEILERAILILYGMAKEACP